MKLIHFSNTKFNCFDSKFLGSATIERGSDYDNTMSVSNFGFCFVRPEEKDTLISMFGHDFGQYCAECEFDGEENFDSTWEDFADWIARDGMEAVKETLVNDGVEYLNLDNGSFFEIIPLDSTKIRINKWEENK